MGFWTKISQFFGGSAPARVEHNGADSTKNELSPLHGENLASSNLAHANGNGIHPTIPQSTPACSPPDVIPDVSAMPSPNADKLTLSIPEGSSLLYLILADQPADIVSRSLEEFALAIGTAIDEVNLPECYLPTESNYKQEYVYRRDNCMVARLVFGDFLLQSANTEKAPLDTARLKLTTQLSYGHDRTQTSRTVPSNNGNHRAYPSEPFSAIRHVSSQEISVSVLCFVPNTAFQPATVQSSLFDECPAASAELPDKLLLETIARHLAGHRLLAVVDPCTNRLQWFGPSKPIHRPISIAI